jgi:hypothetical protein
MSKELYYKVIQGWVEQVYDEDGNCLRQEFVANESEPVERRIIVPEDAEPEEGELEDGELIEHDEDIADLESRERFVEASMIQPILPKKAPAKRRTAKKNG